MPIAINPEETVRFILERERGQEDATVFLVKPPTYKLSEQLWNRARTQETEDGYSGGMPMGTFYRLAAEQCLVGWENFKDAKGAEVPFEGDPLERLEWDDICEIAEHVRTLAKLTKEERGK